VEMVAQWEGESCPTDLNLSVGGLETPFEKMRRKAVGTCRGKGASPPAIGNGGAVIGRVYVGGT